MRLQTQAVHVCHEVDTASGAIAKPINLSVTFERDTDGSYPRGYFYSGKGNPNRNGLEAAFAALEAGRVAVAFASGCSAITAVLRPLKPGDHVIIPDDVFQGTVRILREVLSEWQITYSAIDLSRMASVGPAFRPNTKLVWMETLSNPLLKVTQLKEVSDIAHSHGALSVVDNSFVTPIFQRANLEARRLEFRDVEIVDDEPSGETILEIEVRGKRGFGYCKSMPGAVSPLERLRSRLRPRRVERARAPQRSVRQF
jgi:cystathionine gamma-synthase